MHAAFEEALGSARDAAEHRDVLGHVIAGRVSYAGDLFTHNDPCHPDHRAESAHAADRATVSDAVGAARTAFWSWDAAGHQARNTSLLRIADDIAARHLEFAAVASLETGKTRLESIVEVQEAVDLIRTYVGFVDQNDGYSAPLASYVPGEDNRDVLRPYGVFGVIAPFNFPVALSVGMCVAALAAGNTVVYKPSDKTALCGSLVAEAFASLPDGVFNIIHGGADTGELLVGSDVDGIAFTGSAAVGRQTASAMASGDYPRPALLELGGKNPAIVTESADLAAAAEGIARAGFGLTGQKCSACSRAIVVGERSAELLDELERFTSELVVEDPIEQAAFMGPLIDVAALDRFTQAVDAARTYGRVAIGGGRLHRSGHFVEPTVVADLPVGHPLTRRELFLPFVTVTSVTSFNDALAEANAGHYGLAAGIFTDDDGEADAFFTRIEAGVTYRNRRAGATTGAWPGTQSFCGWKSSGFTGKGGLASFYVTQFMREQSRTVCMSQR
jgi:1-pyrroline-5-carboxylate dehydrogenase